MYFPLRWEEVNAIRIRRNTGPYTHKRGEDIIVANTGMTVHLVEVWEFVLSTTSQLHLLYDSC
jgi:hypothetical protein